MTEKSRKKKRIEEYTNKHKLCTTCLKIYGNVLLCSRLSRALGGMNCCWEQSFKRRDHRYSECSRRNWTDERI